VSVVGRAGVPGRGWQAPALRGLGLLAVAGGSFLLGVALVAVASKAGDAAPLVVAALPLAPLLVIGILADPRIGVVAVFATFPVGFLAVAAGPVNLQAVEGAVLAAGFLVALRRMALGEAPLGWAWPLGFAAAFLISAVAATPSAIDPALALRRDASLLYGFTFATVVLAACSDLSDVRRVLGGFLAGANILTLQGLAGIEELRARFEGGEVTGRAVGAFSSPNEFGSFCALAVLVGVGIAASSRSWRGRILSLLGVALPFLGLALSLSRGAWLGGLVGATFLVLAVPGIRLRAASMAIPIVLGSVLVFVLRPTSPEVQVIGQRIQSLTSLAANPYDDRLEIWDEGLRQVRADPWTGHGPGNFPLASRRLTAGVFTISAIHAHNTFLTVAAEMGIPALMLFLAFLAALWLAGSRTARELLRRGRRGDAVLIAGLGAAVVSLVVQGFVDTTLVQGNQVLDATAWGIVGGLLVGLREVTRSPELGGARSAATEPPAGLTPGRRTPPGGGTPRSEARTS
jgi:putative inorganic carbon (HCO3(-)) transporter